MNNRNSPRKTSKSDGTRNFLDITGRTSRNRRHSQIKTSKPDGTRDFFDITGRNNMNNTIFPKNEPIISRIHRILVKTAKIIWNMRFS